MSLLDPLKVSSLSFFLFRAFLLHMSTRFRIGSGDKDRTKGPNPLSLDSQEQVEEVA